MPADLEMKALAGISADITGIEFTSVVFTGEPVCEVEESNENNGISRRVRLSFVTEGRISYRRHVWIVEKQTGEQMLIGSRESIPKFSCRDLSGGPGTANRAEVTVELESCCAWVSTSEAVPVATGDGTVRFDHWREMTEEEADSIIDNLN